MYRSSPDVERAPAIFHEPAALGEPSTGDGTSATAVAVRQGAAGPIWSAEAIAWRIRWLIAHHDGGDVCAAARRLGVPVGQLVKVEATIADDDPSDTSRPGEALLCAAVRRYGVSTAWVLTGCEQPEPTALPPEVRERLARLCLAVATRVVAEFDAERAAARVS